MLQSKCVCLKDNWLSITSQLTVHPPCVNKDYKPPVPSTFNSSKSSKVTLPWFAWSMAEKNKNA